MGTNVQALLKPEFAAWTKQKGIDVLMIVARAKTAQDNATLIGFVVAVGILQMQQFGALPDVRAAIPQFDASGNHQTVGEDSRFVATPVAIGVFEDEHFVIWHLARFNLWIDRAADDPQPPARVEAHLNRFNDAVLLRGEKVGRKTIGDIERGQFGSGVIRVGSERRNSKHKAQSSREVPNQNRQN